VILRGLPDFHRPLQTDSGAQVFYPFEAGSFVVAPDGLDIATREDGRADFNLELVRSPQQTYGVLDFSMNPSFPMQGALTLLRDKHPDSALKRAAFTGGFLRFVRAGSDIELPQELTQPAAIGWNSLGVSRFILKVSATSASLLKDALMAEALLITAVAEMQIRGVAARAPVSVRSDSARLLSSLLALADANRQLARTALLTFFAQDPAQLPVTIVGRLDASLRADFAEAMADHVQLHLSTPIAAPVEPIAPYVRLAAPETVKPGGFEWNLAEPIVSQRSCIVALHPLDDAVQLVREHGPDAVIQHTTVPPIPLGTHAIAVHVNLPTERPGVLALGVTLHAPARPPQRPAAVTASEQFAPSRASATIQLRLAPLEKLAFSYTTFVVLEQGTAIEKLEGPTILSETDFLSLNHADFPIDFIPIEAEQSLLDIAEISGTCRFMAEGSQREQTFVLDSTRPSVTSVLPKGARDASFEIVAHERAGTGILTLGPLPATSFQLGLFSFPEYGPHKIEIECKFDEQTDLVSIELLPAGVPDTHEALSLQFFTRDQPKKIWTWFAESPFQPGFRYRPRSKPGEPTAPWIEVSSAFEPLTIHLS